ncbi:tRNA (adenosine(37)-N6)-threonylcarbamoyltransferase complex dimerization subunit type 1 TsaB [candidate division WOR-3 bacterium]|nr:tRNA (adenosine(37)-N6)-threonylcarbamoyltransferase complex dimerization subunit type 1 TsaB [candidate division WOR-3 bacterium]
MRILGINTSNSALGIGLIEDKKVVFDLFVKSETFQSEDIVQIMNQWIDKPTEIDGLAVALGPGSFTALRIGLAVVKGLAVGLGKPVVGVPTLDAFIPGIPYAKYKITPILDTKRETIYTATYEKNGEKITSYLTTTPEEFVNRLEGEHIFLGSGVKICSSLIEKKLGKKTHFISPNPESPKGTWVASLGLRRLKKGDYDPIDSLEPIYLHPLKIVKK